MTAVLLPLLSVLAISVTHSEGVYDVGKPLGPVFALTFMVLIHATIGPLFGTPRTATVPFTVGVQPLLPSSMAQRRPFVSVVRPWTETRRPAGSPVVAFAVRELGKGIT